MLKKIIIGIVAFILIFGLGVLVGTKLKSKSATPNGQADTFQSGYDAAKKKLQDQGIGVLPSNIEIKSILGTVQNVSGNSIVIKTMHIENPLSDSDLDLRTIQITSDTNFYQLIQKDYQQFQQELADFQKKAQEQPNNENTDSQQAAAPLPFDKKTITLADIKEGQSITVTANEDIKNKKEFVATEISLQPTPSVPATDTKQ
jgi:hypothetical protein